MSKIKTRDVVKGTIRTLDRAAIASERMKEAYTKTKEKAETSVIDDTSPEEYASERIQSTTEFVGSEAAHQFEKQGEKSVKTTKENIIKAKGRIQDFKYKRAEQSLRRQAEKTTTSSVNTMAQNTANSAIKTRQIADKTVKQTARSSGRKTIKQVGNSSLKTTQKGVKTAEQTAKATIKTSQQAAKATQKAAQATVKASQKAAAETTAQAIKVAVKATIAAVKGIIAGTKALVSAIAAGGWVAVLVIVVICLIALLFGSVFGIFFSGEDSGTGQSMQTVVREINLDYENQIDTIKNNTAYDVLEVSGSRAVWKDVLSVYAVKTNTNPDNPQEVATMDDNKKQLLKDLFWEMNAISSSTKTITEKEIVESDDGHGNIVQTEKTVTRTYLYISVTHKTADEMANQYGFNPEQKGYLTELLKDGNNSLWSAVLYGIHSGDGQIVTVALSQVGNIGGQPYWSWFGFDGRVEWCACFVSWCANECGYIDNGVIPKFAGCVLGSQWFKDRGQWYDNSYIPKAGDIIFFDWEQDGTTDHVGIVERVENNTVYTVEGNSGDRCRQNSYAIGSSKIYGYGVPAY